jgi:hypothetical protein
MSLEKTVEIWETDETLEYQIRHFLLVIRSNKYFSTYVERGVPADFLNETKNYVIENGYDPSLYKKLEQIPTRESLNKKDSIQT